MQKNVASQSVTVVAIDITTGALKTGDAGNITLYYNGDNGGVTVFSTGSGHPSEDDATNSKGTYTIAATQGETNFNRIRISGKSSTSNIQIVPYEIITTPASFGSFTTPPTVGAIATAVWQDTTSGDFTVASSIGKSLYTSGIVPGGSGGLFIAGSNAATTISGLTTGALSCTTITASGAVAFQSTFGVTGATTLTGAVTASNASNNIVGVALGNVAHGGAAATLRLGGSSATPAFYVTNSGGNAVQYESTNGNGLVAIGSSSGIGFYAVGGTAGAGFGGSGASSYGFFADGTGSLPGAFFDGGHVGGDGIAATGHGAGVDIRGNITGNLSGSVGSLTTNNDKTGYTLSSSGLDLVLVAGKTLPNAIKYIGAVTSGKISGAGSGTEVFLDFNNATAVTVTVDSSGNRTGVVLA